MLISHLCPMLGGCLSAKRHTFKKSRVDLCFPGKPSCWKLSVSLVYMESTKYPLANREYLAPQIRSMSNRFHSEAKLPWSYDYPLANHIATNKSSANCQMPLFSRLYPSFGYLGKIFPPRGLKYSLLLSPDRESRGVW